MLIFFTQHFKQLCTFLFLHLTFAQIVVLSAKPVGYNWNPFLVLPVIAFIHENVLYLYLKVS